MSRLRPRILAGALAVLALPASARALPSTAVRCGQTITTSIRVSNDLADCATGLVAGADGITIDLGGHELSGGLDFPSVGVEVDGHAHVTVRDGRLSNFLHGVVLSDGFFDHVRGPAIRTLVSNGSTDIGVYGGGGDRIRGNDLSVGPIGVELSGTGFDRVTDNAIDVQATPNVPAAGLLLFGANGNRIAGNGPGAGASLALIGPSTDPSSANVVARNTGFCGALLGGTGNVFRANAPPSGGC